MNSLIFALALLVGAAACSQAAAQAPKLPSPKWVEMASLDGPEGRLTGFSAPQGVKVEIAFDSPEFVGLVDFAFTDGGQPCALVWSPADKGTADRLVFMRAADGDENQNEVTPLMDDLQRPSGLLFAGGWTYFLTEGRLVRRHAHDAELLAQLQADAKAKTAPPTTVTTGWPVWIEQELVRGLATSRRQPAAGLAIGTDGCLYLTTPGSEPTRAVSWDGSKAAVLSSGCVLRMRLDGSRLREFGRGIACPARPAFDSAGTLFVLDQYRTGEAEAPSCRLLQIQDGADYGWRRTSADESAKCVGRVDQAAHGTLPALGLLGNESPQCAVVCSSPAFPDHFRDLVLYADAANGALRACAIDRDAAPPRVRSAFNLLEFTTDAFSPQVIVQGPDGALYVADGRHGRIYRLTWGGTDAEPAIEAGSLLTWSKLHEAEDRALWEAFDGLDLELRRRAVAEILRRCVPDDAAGQAFRAATQRALVDRMGDSSRKVSLRVSAVHAASQLPDATVYQGLEGLLADERVEVRRAAFEAIGNQPPPERERVLTLAETVQAAWRFSDETPAERAMRLALARLAVAGSSASAEWGFEAASVSHLAGISRESFDAHVRALEIVPGAARELMIGNLEVALFLPEADPQERQRLKEFVTLTAESMRTRELVVFLDALLTHEQDIFAKLDAPLEQRLIACFRRVEVDPPIRCDALLKWIESHPGGPPEVDVAALETIVAVGVSKPDAAAAVAARLLQTSDEALRIRVIQAIGAGKWKGLAKALTAMQTDAKRSRAEQSAIASALKQLQ